jgi:hypothetical protein
MQMRMVLEILAPSMQHRQETDGGTKVLRISGNLQQGLRSGPKQEADIVLSIHACSWRTKISADMHPLKTSLARLAD